MHPDGSDPHTVVQCGNPDTEAGCGQAVLSPDGTKLAFTGGEGALTIANADGSDPRTPPKLPQLDGASPAWSPQGDRIAFISSDGSIETVKADGTSLRTVIPSSQVKAAGGLAWSPDATQIAFGTIPVGNTVPQGELDAVPASGGRVTTILSRVDDGVAGLSWAPASELLFANGHEPGISETDEQGNAKVAYPIGSCADPDCPGGSPSWAPDGIHYSAVDDEGRVVIATIDGGVQRTIGPEGVTYAAWGGSPTSTAASTLTVRWSLGVPTGPNMDVANVVYDERKDELVAVGYPLPAGSGDTLLAATLSKPETAGPSDQWQSIPEPGAGTGQVLTAMGMAYDGASGDVVLLAVAATPSIGTGPGPAAETWLFDGDSWTEAQPDTEPFPPRTAPAMAYDPSLGEVVLFGGRETGLNDVRLGDTWAWNGTDWKAVATGGPAPSPRDFAALGYDAPSKTTLLFGGFGGSATAESTDTWSFSADGWTELPTTKTPPSASHVLTSVGDRGQAFLLGQNDAWVWTGDDWQGVIEEEPPTFPLAAAVAVPGRTYAIGKPPAGSPGPPSMAAITLVSPRCATVDASAAAEARFVDLLCRFTDAASAITAQQGALVGLAGRLPSVVRTDPACTSPCTWSGPATDSLDPSEGDVAKKAKEALLLELEDLRDIAGDTITDKIKDKIGEGFPCAVKGVDSLVSAVQDYNDAIAEDMHAAQSLLGTEGGSEGTDEIEVAHSIAKANSDLLKAGSDLADGLKKLTQGCEEDGEVPAGSELAIDAETSVVVLTEDDVLLSNAERQTNLVPEDGWVIVPNTGASPGWTVVANPGLFPLQTSVFPPAVPTGDQIIAPVIGSNMSVSSTSIEAGNVVTVAGSGFLPVSPVTVVVVSPPTRLDVVTSNQSGSFSADVPIPTTVPSGPNTLEAIGVAAGGVAQVARLGQASTSGTPRVIAAAITVRSAPTRAGAPIRCAGTIGGAIAGDLTVPAGGVCTVAHATVGGGISVGRGAVFEADFSTVNGNVAANAPLSFVLCGDHISGSVSVRSPRGPKVIGRSGNPLCERTTIAGAGAPPAKGSGSAWPWVGGGVVVLLLAGAFAARFRLRRKRPADPA